MSRLPTVTFALLLSGCLVDADTWATRRALLSDVDRDGWTPQEQDCDDADPTVNPSAPELCDGVDNDCDGAADDVDQSWAPDVDGDGWGDAADATTGCDHPTGWVDTIGDCDDHDPEVSPAALEQCNAADDDCDGQTDEDLETATWYRDADGDGYGATDETLTACGTPTGRSELPGDCDDADARVSPAATEVCDDGIDQDCDGTGAGCTWEGSAPSTDWPALLGAAGDGAGLALAVGDTDGDGQDDVLVGSAGRVWLSDGRRLTSDLPLALGIGSRATASFETVSTDLAFGTALAVCDLDGDGAGELIVGGTNAIGDGAVVVYDGSGVGELAPEDARYARLEVGTGLGASVACGDVNDDGAVDVLAGAPRVEVSGAANTGAVLVLYGATAASAWTPDFSPETGLTYGSPGTQGLGASLAVLDTDGDGSSDVLAGAQPGDGVAWLVPGYQWGEEERAADDGTRLVADDGGEAVVAGGDLDGDGYDDVVLGFPSATVDGSLEAAGAVYVVYASELGSEPDPDWKLENASVEILGAQAGDRLGSALAVVRTEDGPLVAIGAPGADDGGAESGRMDLWDATSLRGSLDASSAPVSRWSDDPGAASGAALATGDLDGDGRPDLLLAAPADDLGGTRGGAVFLGYGSGR